MTKLRRSDQSRAEPVEVRWYNTPYPYIGAALLALIICDFLGRYNSTMELGAGVFTFVYVTAVSLLVLYSAKDHGVIHVLLILLFPPYTVFYLCAVNEDKSLIALWFSGLVAILSFVIITLG